MVSALYWKQPLQFKTVSIGNLWPRAAEPSQAKANVTITMALILHSAHLNRDKIGSNLSVPGIQGCLENTLIKTLEMSPNLKCQLVSIKIPLLRASQNPDPIQRLALQGS